MVGTIEVYVIAYLILLVVLMVIAFACLKTAFTLTKALTRSSRDLL